MSSGEPSIKGNAIGASILFSVVFVIAIILALSVVCAAYFIAKSSNTQLKLSLQKIDLECVSQTNLNCQKTNINNISFYVLLVGVIVDIVLKCSLWDFSQLSLSFSIKPGTIDLKIATIISVFVILGTEICVIVSTVLFKCLDKIIRKFKKNEVLR